MTNVPKIAKSDFIKKWHSISTYEWHETPSTCAVCVRSQVTGDITMIFGDLDSAIAKRWHCCVHCGMELLHDGQVPSAMAVYVEKQHHNKDFDKLDKEIQERIVEGFAILDRLTTAFDGKKEEASS